MVGLHAPELNAARLTGRHQEQVGEEEGGEAVGVMESRKWFACSQTPQLDTPEEVTVTNNSCSFW